MKIYTRKGDDGTTGLLYGGRVPKDSPLPVAYGAADETQAALGLARAACEPGSEVAELLLHLERDLWVLMSELATGPENRAKLTPGQTLVTAGMVVALEERIDDLSERFEPPTEFVVPGETEVAARLDVARTVARRAEREAITALAAVGVAPDASQAVPYLNRLSDLLWTMARWQEGGSRPTRSVG